MDDGDDVRWVSYRELAEARRIKPAAAVRLTQRRRWPRRPGNDGGVRVGVPERELRPPKSVTRDDAPDVAPSNEPQIQQAIAALKDAVATLQAQLKREVGRADAAEHRELVREQWTLLRRLRWALTRGRG